MVVADRSVVALTTGQVASALGVNRRTIANLVDAGQIPAGKLPSHHRHIRPEDALDFARRNGYPTQSLEAMCVSHVQMACPPMLVASADTEYLKPCARVGFDVAPALTVGQAWQMLMRRVFAVVLVDLSIGRDVGRELLSWLAGQSPYTLAALVVGEDEHVEDWGARAELVWVQPADGQRIARQLWERVKG